MQGREDLLLTRLREFYDQPHNAEVLLDVLQQRGGYPSLRILDWLITNFSRTRNVLHSAVDSKGSLRQMSISINYRLQLRAYSKRRFDPFCRRDRIVFAVYDPRKDPEAPACSIKAGLPPKASAGELTWPAEGQLVREGPLDESRVHQLVTTVGQINFMRWAISNDVLGYAIAHEHEIE